jgi:hypothetical protein
VERHLNSVGLLVEEAQQAATMRDPIDPRNTSP